MLMLIVGYWSLIVGYWSLFQWHDGSLLENLGLWGPVGVFIVMFLVYFKREALVKVNANMHCFSFEADEAFHVLTKCLDMRDRPTEYMRPLLGSSHRTRLFVLFPPFPAAKRQFRTFWRGADAYLDEKYIPPFYRLDMWLFARLVGVVLQAVGYPIRRTIDFIWRIVAWFRILMIRFALRSGIKAIGNFGLGQDVDFIVAVSRRPTLYSAELRAVGEKLECIMRERASEGARTIGQTLAGTLYGALTRESFATVLEELKTALSADWLAHGQYYQRPEIVDQIAELIAASSSTNQPE